MAQFNDALKQVEPGQPIKADTINALSRSVTELREQTPGASMRGRLNPAVFRVINSCNTAIGPFCQIEIDDVFSPANTAKPEHRNVNSALTQGVVLVGGWQSDGLASDLWIDSATTLETIQPGCVGHCVIPGGFVARVAGGTSWDTTRNVRQKSGESIAHYQFWHYGRYYAVAVSSGADADGLHLCVLIPSPFWPGPLVGTCAGVTAVANTGTTVDVQLLSGEVINCHAPTLGAGQSISPGAAVLIQVNSAYHEWDIISAEC